MKLVTSAEMRALEERAAAEGRPPEVLMEDAGLGVAQEVWIDQGAAPERTIVVLVGPGNNGGDGLVAARHLAEWGADVSVVLLSDRGEDDPLLKRLVDEDVAISNIDAIDSADAIVDAVLGTGRARPLQGAIAEALDRARRSRAKVYAVDLPTGVDADTGTADAHALRADTTVVLGCSKAGLHTLPGAEYAGRIEVVDIGLPSDAVEALPVELLNARWVRERLPSRPAGGNKGTFGRVLVVAGARSYVGAARLAAQATARAGAGLVTIACPATVQPLVASGLSEATYLPLPSRAGAIAPEAAVEVARALAGYDVLLLGPGLGTGAGQESFVRQLLTSLDEEGPAAVIDADGLNALARLPHWWERVRARCVLTPHPGEFARLTNLAIADIQSDRLAAAREAAERWRQTVVLKGAYTVIAAPDGRAGVNPYANPALASAGTGDVLTGAAAGLLAQGAPPFEAACAAAYVHAAAAEGLRGDLGEAGLLAGDLLVELPRTLRELRAI